MKVIKYQIVEATSSYALTEKINEYLQRGYELQGGVSVSATVTGSNYYCQALIFVYEK